MRVQAVKVVIVSIVVAFYLYSPAFAVPPTWTINGVVTTAEGTGVEGVNFIGDNGATSAVTTADGSYAITVPNHWDGTITVSKSGWLITPDSNTYTNISDNITGENYTAYQPKISGYVKKTDGTPLVGANVSASDGGGSNTTDASGYYEIYVPYDWSGSVSASLMGYYFADENYINVTTDQPSQDFSGYQPTINGSAGLSGVTIDVSGVGTVISNPTYSVIVPYSWSGTVQASLSGYHFPESPRTYTNVISDQAGQDFTPYQPIISGAVTKEDCMPLAGSMVTSSYGSSDNTDVSGVYEIVVPYDWSGTVSATLSGYYFSDKNYSNVVNDLTGQDFVGYQPTISGIVSVEDGSALEGVSVSADNGGGTDLTDPNGAFEIVVPYDWSGSVTANKADWGFTEFSKAYQNVTADLSGQDFTGFQPVISGMVSDGMGTGVEDVLISVDGTDSVVTNAQGYYEITVPYGWSGTVTPSKTDWGFSLVSRSYSNVVADQTAQDYLVFQPIVSGYINDGGLVGGGIEGIEVAADGVGTTLTDSNGYYEFVVPYGWSGDIIPSKTDWGFNPLSRSFTDVIADTVNQNFILFQPQVRLLFQRANQSHIQDVWITVTGFSEPILADYDFPAQPGFYLTVPYGWSGSIIPSKDGFAFEPIVQDFTNVVSDSQFTFWADYGYPGGSGTEADPYQIWTAEDLHELTAMSDDWDQHFILMADIDLSDLNAPQPVRPIGNTDVYFKGSFDGNNHTISHLELNWDYNEPVGLFGYVFPAGEPGTLNCFIKNLGLIDPDISSSPSSYNGVGAVVGRAYGYGGSQGGNPIIIENCYVQGGSVQGYDGVGGLVGSASGNCLISLCSSQTTVSGTYEIGGFIGVCGWETYINQCYADCIVSGVNAVGGFAGSGIQESIGGIWNCYSHTSVSGDDYIGGFIGQLGYQQADSDPLIINCYSAGSVTATGEFYGGFAASKGYDYAVNNQILSCYWDVETSGQSESAVGEGKTTLEMMSAETYQGWGCNGVWTLQEGVDYPRLAWQGLPGDLFPQQTYSGGSGTSADPYLISTPQELNAINNNYCHLDGSFRLIADLDMSELADGEFEPIGSTMTFTGTFDGNGHSISNLTYINTEDDRGEDAAGLFAVAGNRYDDTVSAEIYDLTLIDPNIIQGGMNVSSHCGSLVGIAGGGVSISNITVINASVSNTTGETGGVVGLNSGQMTDVTCSGNIENLLNSSLRSGGIVGYNSYGTLTRCDFTGVVTSPSSGGLVGRNYGGNIAQCRAKATVSGDSNVGGLAGSSYYTAIISDSYCQCDVQGNSNVGGLCGYVYRVTISDCYSVGLVTATEDRAGGFIGEYYRGGDYYTYPSTFTGCFWNTDYNPDLTSFGGFYSDGAVIGESTENLILQSTYTNAGWDFVDETVNGTEDIWQICDGEAYPKLPWETLTCTDFIGSGTSEDPYQIRTGRELYYLSIHPEYWEQDFILSADIDLGRPGMLQPDSIGYYGKPFRGNFNGNGHSIANLSLAVDQDYTAFFGHMENANVFNLNLIQPQVEVSNYHSFVGALFGRADNTGIVDCKIVDGIVSSPQSSNVGIIGGYLGDYSRCINNTCNGSVEGRYHVGGLVGQCYGFHAELIGSTFTGDVIGTHYVGGAIGRAYYSYVNRCGVKGSVAGYYYTGGFAGQELAYLYDCFSQCSVSGTERIGGFVGDIGNGSFQIVRCYCAGTVSDGIYAGAFAGYHYPGSPVDYRRCFWDMQLTPNLPGISNAVDADLVGQTTSEMQTENTFTSVGWDFVGETANGTKDIWQISGPGMYPELATQPFEFGLPYSGNGIEGDPYVLSVPEHLIYLSNTYDDWSKHFVLANDIDMTGHLFIKPVIGGYYEKISVLYSGFTGVFDGSGHVISNVTIEAEPPIDQPYSYATGFFGSIYSDNYDGQYSGIVKSLGLENIFVSGDESVGGLAGIISANRYDSADVPASVQNCYTTGTIEAGIYAGGLVGYMDYCKVQNSYSKCQVDSGDHAGGLTGYCYCSEIDNCFATGDARSTNYYAGGFIGRCMSGYDVAQTVITNCYARGNVTSYNGVGGFAGNVDAGSTVRNCYSTGRVTGTYGRGGFCGYRQGGTVSGCFWDTQTSSITYSAGATGLVTEQMYNISSYLNAGWDLIDTWTICSGTNYPRFRNIGIPIGDFACPDGVALEDYAYLSQFWLQDCNESNNYCEGTDLDGMGSVGLEDMLIFCENWLTGIE